MNIKSLFLIPVILLTVLAGGCATNVGEAKSQEYTRTAGGVEVIPIRMKDVFGHEVYIAAVREDNGNGEYKTSLVSTSGPGFLTSIGPAAASGIFFWAGMDALDPDRTNVNATGGNASSDQSQRGVNSGRQRQGQRGTNNGSQGTSGSRKLNPPSTEEKP